MELEKFDKDLIEISLLLLKYHKTEKFIDKAVYLKLIKDRLRIIEKRDK